MKTNFLTMPIWLFVLDCAVVVWDVFLLVKAVRTGEWLGFWILLPVSLFLIFQMITVPFPRRKL